MIADGWTRRIFRGLLDAGELPEISEGLVAGGGLLDVVSNLPTVSLASHTTILTATHQSEHGVVGHRWLNPGSGVRRNYLGLTGPKQVNADISPNVMTVYEQHPGSVSVQGVITRGAAESVHIPTMRSGPILRKTAEYAIANPQSVIVTWLPRGDAVAHTYGPDSPQVASDMRETSVAIGDLIQRLGQVGLADQARFLLIPDHGHRAVTKTVRLERLLGAAGLDTVVNSRQKARRSLTLTSGDSSALVYLTGSQRTQVFAHARQISQCPEIELACAITAPNELRFFHRDGESTVRYLDARARYRCLAGSDPLGLCMEGGEIEVGLDTPTLQGKYPDFLHQISRSFVPG
jgi:hypothetical protein